MSKKEELLAKLAKLSPEKRAFLEKQLMSKAATGIPRRSADEPCELSFAQQRLWFLEQFEPGLPTYNMQFLAGLDGVLRVDVLQRCLNEIIDRHEVLRTTYRAVNGEPRQDVQPAMPLQISVTDLRSLPATDRLTVCNRELRAEAAQPFDLEKGPLLRASIWQVEDQQYKLLVSMHHIAGDGWSAGVMVRELAALYKAFSEGKPSPLPLLDIQYADFAQWQRKYLQDGVLAKQLDYWKRQLSGELPILNLPHDKTRPSMPSYRGASEPIQIARDLTERLRQFSQEEGGTLFMTLLAAYYVLLYRYTAQDDLLVGTPIANRTQADIQPLVGFFVNTLVLRTSMSNDITFRELVQRVRAVCLDAYAHQEVPFEKLVAELVSDRSTSHSVLFQTMFSLNPSLDLSLEVSDLKLTLSSMDTGTAKFDLFLQLFEGADGVQGTVDYSTDLFHASTMQRLAGHYTTLLESIVADPDLRVTEIPILTPADAELLNSWNDNHRDYPTERCIHQLFEAQVERTPDATALVFDHQRFTYRELNQRANQVAHHLQQLGVGPEVFAGVCMERSLEMVIAMLGILKAGGAYVPLDPKYPKDRIQFMMEDAKAPVLLTQQRLVGEFADQQTKVICIDTEWSEVFADQPQENPVSEAHARNLAYVIYTSGSTGKPKGVAIEHFNVNRFIHWVQDTFTQDEMAGVLFSTSICFDLSVYELFATLATGGKVILVENALHLPQAPAAQEVTLINTVPSAIAELLKMNAIPSNVRVVNLAGEPLKNFLVQKLYSLEHVDKVYNLYGPSEDTTYSTYALMERGSESEPLIGVPIHNTQAYILDQNLRHVPIGATGELYLAGDGLARGYLHRPDLTEERFISDPFSKTHGARMYKTGDLARFLENGQIDYQGRIDHQVKVRGFRIELGEIEAKLSKHPTVRETVVIVREDQPGDQRLTAYLVVDAEESVEASAWSAYLRDQLPGYMIPSAYVVLSALPLTPNGKVDRKALPVPDMRAKQGGDHVEPRTPMEKSIAAILQEVLHVEDVGAEANFFELGGHSLLATQVISRINDAFSVQVSLKAFFEAPTVAGLAACVQRLQGQNQAEVTALARISRDQPLKLSFAQQRLWVLDQLLDQDSAAYNIPGAVRLQGPLDVGALQRALNEIIARHEVLRTRFAEVDGQPVQVITEAADVAFPTIDLSSLASADREAQVLRLFREEAQHAFDLSAESLVRFALVQLADDEHVLVLNFHHIVFDGWSLSVFVKEFVPLYAAFAAGQESPLSPLPIQYADYAAWQREWLEGETMHQQLSYWQQQLAGLPVLQLPTDRPRPAVLTNSGATKRFTFSRELTDALHAVGQQHGATLFMTLLAGFQTLLYRYSGQDDLAIGTPIAGRSRREIEDLIGFFVNTLVLRADLSGDPTFVELLLRVRETALQAYAHQDVPFERLVEALQPERDTSRSPLFQVMFLLQNFASRDVELEGLTVQQIPFEDNTTAKFDLTLAMEERADGLIGTWEYNTDLYDAETIQRLTDHFRLLLTQIAAAPQESVAMLALLTDEERRQLLLAGNQFDRSFEQDDCLHERFSQQAAKTPDKIALVFEDQQLTYRELNARANQLAHVLRRHGVGPDTLVGLCVERSLDTVIGLLGILKAGGAYVPLDPANPQERLSYILEDSQVAVLVTQSHLLDGLHAPGVHAICLDTDSMTIEEESTENPVNFTEPQHLAYVIYTSGSTGKPKGVLVAHQSVARLFTATDAWYRFGEQDVWTMFHSYAFDFSVWEIWGALLYGGKLVVVPFMTSRSPEDFYRLLVLEGVTVLNQTPSAFRQLMQAEHAVGQRGELNLRYIIFGGEALELQTLKPWFLRHGDQSPQLVNMYGITETTVHVTYRPISMRDMEAGRGSVIGVPIPDQQLYVLDKHLQPVPHGVIGEIYVGGAGLARGYLNQPELTAERFLPNPFPELPGDRLYKSGDLARRLSNGELEYAGRIDHQVKIRGFRIELGEIEAALHAHPCVREAAVIIREDIPGDKRLVAYLVLETDTIIDSQDLRTHAKNKLTEYMVPSAFVVLDAFPLTNNGKLDQRALPAPQMEQMRTNEFIAPRTAVEQQIASIFAEVLGVTQVGAEDNFFELGGHSLLAIQAVTRLQSAFGMPFTLLALFESQTVERLAQHVQSLKPSALEEIPVVPRDQPLKLSFGQQRLWVLNQFLSDPSAYNIPGAFRLRGQLNATALQRTLDEMIDRHEVLRTTFAEVDGEPVQVIAERAAAALHQIDLRTLLHEEREAKVNRLIREEAQHAFDLSAESLVRFTLAQLADEEYVLVLNFHHIVFDGWSLTVFVKEFAQLYAACAAGQDSPLSPLQIQYADYAAWQREWLEGETMHQQLSYWQQQLVDLPVMQLPTDRPRPSVQTYNGANVQFTLSRELADSLHALGQEHGTTLFMTLLAGFQTLLYRYSGQEDLAVGTPIAGRSCREVEDLIGFFVNTLVLRADLSGDPTFVELLQRVRQTALQAYAHQDVPFERLVEALQPERDTSRSPLFQVMFLLQNFASGDVELEGVTVEQIPFEDNATAKFDLTLAMEEHAEGLTGTWEYNTDLYDAETIQRMTDHFRLLLAQIAAAPQESVAKLALLTDEERHQLLLAGNQFDRSFAQQECLHERFSQQAAKTPDKIALVFEDQQLTYRDLNARANQLAHVLRCHGVGPDTLVGLYVERSMETVIGLLGILKAGGAYVPLDPANPQERLSYILEDSQVAVLVTQSHLLDGLDAPGVHVICLDTESIRIAQESTENPDNFTKPQQLAYVIYTSGSTGKPKGVLMPHQSVVRLFTATDAWYQFGEQDVWTMFHSYAFDFSVWEIWGALLYGGKLVVVPFMTSRSPEEFYRLLVQEGVTVLNQTPSAFRQLMQAEQAVGQRGELSLRYIIFGGEALELQTLKPWFLRHGDMSPQLVNMYGITETTVHVTYRPITMRDVEAGRGSVIGVPIPDQQLYVLDKHLQPVPHGVIGEIYVGGAGLARGYLNQPELTAERFLPNPFSELPGDRLYKSGDLARRLSNGELEYAGRIDHQVKIRGFRIELGEIEAALLAHPCVLEVAVIIREDIPGDKRLVAYLVPETDTIIDSQDLRTHAKNKLTEYMVPSAFVVLDALPLTNNGKLDQRALPAPQLEQMRTNEFIAPRTAVEQQIASIFAEVLGVAQVGAEDNFFELGGHSLLAIQAVTRLQLAFGVPFTLLALFESPTVERLSHHVESSKPSTLEVIPVAPRDQPLKLSFGQQRLWVLNQFLSDRSAYNIPFAFRLNGSLDATALQRTIHDIIVRHEVMRTTFAEVDGEPVQVIAERPSSVLHQIDLRTLPDAEREAQVNRLLQQEAQHAFDLSAESLVRFTLAKLTDDAHVMVLNFHHIVFDGWSLNVFYEEFVHLYGAYAAGQESPLSPLAIQYADYAAWQRGWLEGETMHQQLSYWQQQLTGLLPLQMRTDRSRPSVQTYKGAIERFTLPRALTDALRTLGQQHGATLFMTLLTGFQALLYRYSGQDDFAVGTPTAGRSRREIEDLIGFFVNTLVLRADLSGDPSFVDLLKRAQETALQAYAHADVPFEKLVEVLQPERDTSRSPLFQVMFMLQNFASKAVELDGLSVEQIAQVGGTTSKFDLTLAMEEHDGELNGTWEYNTDLYDARTMERLTGHFHTLLEQVAMAPDSPIGALSLLSDAERVQLLNEWSHTAQPFEQKFVHHRFEEQAARTPDAPAVVFGSRSLTYRELNEQSNQLARRLQREGVGPEALVGVCLERSPEMLIALLAVLKAGGAYVPIDPKFPVDRIAYILEETQAAVLLTEEHLRASLPLAASVSLCLDSLADLLCEESAENLDTEVNGNHLVYVIFTSGSTGRPKGVEIEHAAFANFLYSMNEELRVDASDVMLAVATISFDIATLELFLPLTIGAKIVLASRETAVDGHRLAALLEQEKVTVMQATPATWYLMLQTGWTPKNLTILSGGEAFPAELAERLLQGSGKVFNGYGPTEATVYTTCQQVLQAESVIPIGRPIANMSCYVLNDRLQPVPIGVAGELYIGGAGLARGYFKRPDLTEKAFVNATLQEGTTQRLYKTGDLVCYRADGTLEYIGRIDNQIKLRGYRIELGEIEAVLMQHSAIERAVAIVIQDEQGDSALVAYVVHKPGTVSAAGELRAHLREKLPEYMIPSAIVELPDLPLSPNGKVDRKALPQPIAIRHRAPNSYAAPRDLLEWQMARLWEATLAVPQVGVTDNFFELGGHSLTAVRLMARIENQWGQALPVAALFKAPTIEQLVSWMRTQDASATPATLVEIQPQGTQRPLFLVHPIGGHVLSYVELAGELGTDQPFYALQAPGVEDDRTPLSEVEALAALYVQEVRNVQPQGPYRIGGWSFGGVVAYEMAQQLKRAGEHIEQLILLDSFAPTEANRALLGTEADDLADYAYDLASRHGRQLPAEAQQEFASLQSETEQLAYLIDRIRRLDLLPADIGRQQVLRQIEVFRSLRRAYRRYSPSVYEGTITLISAGEPQEPALGWRELAAEVEVTVVPATHFSLLQAPQTGIVAQQIQSHLKETTA